MEPERGRRPSENTQQGDPNHVTVAAGGVGDVGTCSRERGALPSPPDLHTQSFPKH